jgi:double-stranded uracil-DNA glycosylase
VAGDRAPLEPDTGSLRPAPGTVGRVTASRGARPTRPSRADLAAAYGTSIPDLLGPDLAVLFCGINPGLWSGATGLHFARPGNRFWPALHGGGFTPRLLDAAEQHLLPGWGLGITNLVSRATARADELTPDELRAGGEILTALAARTRPRYVAVLGVTAYRAAFAEPKARTGAQSRTLAGANLWILPNPSGLNAHYTAAALGVEFAGLRGAAGFTPPR